MTQSLFRFNSRHQSFPVRDPAEVEIHTRSGGVYKHREEVAPGQPDRPLSADAIKEKFRANAEAVLPDGRAEAIIALVDRLEVLGDVRELGSALRVE